jgi:hypothetical protein
MHTAIDTGSVKAVDEGGAQEVYLFWISLTMLQVPLRSKSSAHIATNY